MIRIKRATIFTTILIALTLLFFTTASAQVPVSLSHQGRLLDEQGRPVQGDVELTFTIYNSQNDGEVLWQEVHPVDLGDSGFYSLTLGGDDNPLDASLFGGTATFLGVQIDDHPELTPRIAFNSVPYAAVADRAQSAAIADSVAPGSIGLDALADDFSISWSDLDDVPPAIAGLDYTNAPYLFEAQSTPLIDAAFGENRTDDTAYNGQVRFVSSSDTADPDGVDDRVWSLHTDSLGHLLATGHTAVIARVKVANNSSPSPIARLLCKATREGNEVELNSVEIIPSQFLANQTWRHYLVHCDFRPNDEAQYIGIEDFQTSITDLSIDYVRIEGLPDAPYISSSLILNDAVQSRHIASNAVGTSQLANNSVTSAQIASNAVNTGQLVNNSVTNAKIASSAVNTNELANSAVTNAKIANNTITRAKIKDPIAVYRVSNERCAQAVGTITTTSTCINPPTTCGGISIRFTRCDGSCGSLQPTCPNTLIGYLAAP